MSESRLPETDRLVPPTGGIFFTFPRSDLYFFRMKALFCGILLSSSALAGDHALEGIWTKEDVGSDVYTVDFIIHDRIWCSEINKSTRTINFSILGVFQFDERNSILRIHNKAVTESAKQWSGMKSRWKIKFLDEKGNLFSQSTPTDSQLWSRHDNTMRDLADVADDFKDAPSSIDGVWFTSGNGEKSGVMIFYKGKFCAADVIDDRLANQRIGFFRIDHQRKTLAEFTIYSSDGLGVGTEAESVFGSLEETRFSIKGTAGVVWMRSKARD